MDVLMKAAKMCQSIADPMQSKECFHRFLWINQSYAGALRGLTSCMSHIGDEGHAVDRCMPCVCWDTGHSCRREAAARCLSLALRKPCFWPYCP